MVDFEHARKMMVDTQLRINNVTDWPLLAAFSAVPRERFVPAERRPLAYIDETHPLGNGRYLSAPTPLARLIQLAAIEPEDRVLVVGAQTGYAMALISRLAKTVVGLESDAALATSASENLAGLDLANVTVKQGPLDAGVKGEPFNVIVIDGSVETVPPALISQLAEGGRLVTLIRDGLVAVAHIFVKAGANVTARAEFDASLPPLPLARRPEEFVF